MPNFSYEAHTADAWRYVPDYRPRSRGSESVPHLRRCHVCQNVATHATAIAPDVCCAKCGSQDTRCVRRIGLHDSAELLAIAADGNCGRAYLVAMTLTRGGAAWLLKLRDALRTAQAVIESARGLWAVLPAEAPCPNTVLAVSEDDGDFPEDGWFQKPAWPPPAGEDMGGKGATIRACSAGVLYRIEAQALLCELETDVLLWSDIEEIEDGHSPKLPMAVLK